jgi:serine protease
MATHSRAERYSVASSRDLCAAARAALLLSCCLCLLAADGASARRQTPRHPPEKPARTRLGPSDDPGRVVIKFAEGSGLRSVAAAAGELRRAGLPSRALRRLFHQAASELDARRAAGEQRGTRALADLNLYFELAVPPSLDTGALCDALNELPLVELALPGRLPLPPPTDLPPTTPTFTLGQGYRSAAPYGVGVDVAASISGVNGFGVAIADVEYQWVLDHEDLELSAAANLETATLLDPYPADQGNHGTAVLGVLGARRNLYGVVGLAHAATRFVVPTNTVQYGYDPVRAIGLALGALGPGDIMLIEQQTWVCGGPLGPLEGYPPWFDAIASATAQGIIVIEPAGNGGLDLDGLGCNGWFDRAVRDSGAILVGAGSPQDHSRLNFSAFGSRVDVQGWGSGVWSTGYGDLFDPGDLRQRYTAGFNGTSSAAAIVAGAAAAVQGAVWARGLAPLDPDEMRTLLVATGTPQGGTDPIGPLPNVVAALGALGISVPTSSSCGLTGLECAPLLLLLLRLRRPRRSAHTPSTV